MKVASFKREMDRLAALYDRPFGAAQFDAWWAQFGRYSAPDFRAAIDEAMVDSGYMPGAGHVLKHIRAARHEEDRAAPSPAPQTPGSPCPPEQRRILSCLFGSVTRSIPPAFPNQIEINERRMAAKRALDSLDANSDHTTSSDASTDATHNGGDRCDSS